MDETAIAIAIAITAKNNTQLNTLVNTNKILSASNTYTNTHIPTLTDRYNIMDSKKNLYLQIEVCEEIRKASEWVAHVKVFCNFKCFFVSQPSLCMCVVVSVCVYSIHIFMLLLLLLVLLVIKLIFYFNKT